MAKRLSAERTASSKKLALVPALSIEGVERYTNLTSFIGRTVYYTVTAQLLWNLDVAAFANIRSAGAEAAAARAREEKARLAAHDAIYRTWATLRSNLVQSRSAHTQARVSGRAAELARDRYEAGADTQLDLLTAQRDAFQAEANRIKADANLANSRVQLRVVAGLSQHLPPRGETP